VLLPTKSRSCVLTTPSQYETEIRMAPGSYELKVALRDGKNFGRAEIPVTVEKTDPEHLAISQIALGNGFHKISGVEEGNARDTYEPLVSNGFEIIQTTDPQFEKRGPFSFYLEVYDPPQSGVSAQDVQVQLQIVDAQTRRLAMSIKPFAAANYAKPGDPVIPIGAGIDTSDLQKGSYILEARARDSAGDSTPWRAAKFTIGE
jgi:hypothetical protein